MPDAVGILSCAVVRGIARPPFGAHDVRRRPIARASGTRAEEVERYRDFDYVVLNDEVERAAAELAAVVLAERARRARQESLARRVLSTFPEPPPTV